MLEKFHFWKLLFPGNLSELVATAATSCLSFPLPEMPFFWIITPHPSTQDSPLQQRVILAPQVHSAKIEKLGSRSFHNPTLLVFQASAQMPLPQRGHPQPSFVKGHLLSPPYYFTWFQPLSWLPSSFETILLVNLYLLSVSSSCQDTPADFHSLHRWKFLLTSHLPITSHPTTPRELLMEGLFFSI